MTGLRFVLRQRPSSHTGCDLDGNEAEEYTAVTTLTGKIEKIEEKIEGQSP